MNIYKVTRGKSKVEVTAKNIKQAEEIARPILHCYTGIIKIQYVETKPEATVTPNGIEFNLV